ncbi:MAG: hypothetical protein QM493_06890 [Sulfurovum sp.]
MKHLYLLLFLLTGLFSASLEHITINNQDFSIVKQSYDIYDSKGEFLKIYREERNDNLIFLLRLTLEDATGKCSNKSVEDGSYEINGKVITLYSYWDRVGRAYNSPYGARITRYEVQKSGKLKKLSSRVYIETQRKNYDPESGIKYLAEEPKTVEEKELLREYIEDVERRYEGTFVYKEEAKDLLKEVRKALERKSKARWNK